MRRCYHQLCDYAGNPELNPGHTLFLSKTAQAVALAVADLAEGLKDCDLTHLLKKDTKDEASVPRELPEEEMKEKEVAKANGAKEAITRDLLQGLFKHLKVQDMPRRAQASPQASPFVGPVSGPYQPNYGNQYNIGHLTVNVAAAPAASPASPVLASEERQILDVMNGSRTWPPFANSPMLIKFTNR